MSDSDGRTPRRSQSCEPSLSRTLSGNISEALTNQKAVAIEEGGGGGGFGSAIENPKRNTSHLPRPLRGDSDATNNYSTSLQAPTRGYKSESAEPDFARGEGRATRLSSTALEALGEQEGERLGEAGLRLPALSPTSPNSSVAGMWGGASSAGDSVNGGARSPAGIIDFDDLAAGGDRDISDTGFRAEEKEGASSGSSGEKEAEQPPTTERKDSPTDGLAQRRGANFGPAGDCDITHGSDIDWGKWGQWVTCVCVVGFDLETGNAVERVVPSHAKYVHVLLCSCCCCFRCCVWCCCCCSIGVQHIASLALLLPKDVLYTSHT